MPKATPKEMTVLATAGEGLEDEKTPRPKIDFSRLTLGELDKLETLSGLPISALADDDAPKGKFIAALVFIASRRHNEPMTWDQCLAMPVDEASAYVGLDDEDEAADDGTDALDEDEAPKD